MPLPDPLANVIRLRPPPWDEEAEHFALGADSRCRTVDASELLRSMEAGYRSLRPLTVSAAEMAAMGGGHDALEYMAIAASDTTYRDLCRAVGLPEESRLTPGMARMCLEARGFVLPPRVITDPLDDGWSRAVRLVDRSRR